MFFLKLVPQTMAALARWRKLGLALSPGLLAPALALAQGEVPPETLQLRNSAALEQAISPLTRSLLPTFVSGDLITGRTDLETVVQGHAMLRKGDMVIRADRLDYNQPTDLARASGHVRINKAGNVYEGPLMELRVDAFEGFFNQPSYHFLANGAHGQADQIDFLDDQRAVIHNATFTTCKRQGAPDWMPAWILKATQLSIDNVEDMGAAEGALLSFKGVPLLPIPYLTFPLSSERKSGLLPPTLGVDNVNGFEVALPYYWNIAPNRDATFTPTVMTRRGVNLGVEFRYLEPTYSGATELDWMPSDKLRDDKRWSLNATHQGTIDSGWTDSGLALNLSLNRVSDNDYWRDFTRAGGSSTQLLSATETALFAANTLLTQRLLANDARLAWANGPFSSMVRTLKWQTLQDATAAIVPPYDRMPQIATRYAKTTAQDLNLSADVDYTQFHSDSTLTKQANAQRIFSLLQTSRTWRAPEGFITPKLQLHATQYQFDAPLSNGATQVSRVVPTFSLDSGLVFERDTQFFGRALSQTLEPRAFYVHTPYRDQSLLPNYDSGANDFNISTVYTENAFVGNDRISDSHLLTLGVTSRLLDPDTGAEAARFGIAQRLLFDDQKVTLPGGVPLTDRLSDVLLGGSVNWTPHWNVNGTIQYNPDIGRSVRSTVGASYRPGSYRTLTAAYRFQRNSSEQIDLGWQWPLANMWRSGRSDAGEARGAGRWYSVGRLNYSMNESQMVNTVLGFEYDADCWLGRIVFERLQTSTATATQRIMFQLEFVGFSRLGVSPLKTLKDNVPGYQILHAPAGEPSRFSNYD
ncbi:LPS-assembly protein LptD [Rhodoferax antarcticus]|uniref:LPS-assembly protein LptD n=2 Tax=Rhodoferax antarcticus TaxID=81479 RepID=A0A1Q8YGK2_9BURK|nr:LPS-assembly protein LptD [Rhodoferax antarcticus]OLP07188.1 organic solvent tolerance protein [Rhodoferax antarcticus ANT.BR]